MSSRGGQYKKYSKAAKRQLTLAVVATLMLGSTPAWAAYITVDPRTTDNQLISSGNTIIMDDTKATVTNSDSSLSMKQYTRGTGTWSDVFGGAGTGDIKQSNNTITITGTEVSNVRGNKMAESGTDNTVTLNRATAFMVYGGYANTAASNTVKMQDGSTAETVYGGFINGQHLGNAEKNTVTLTGGSSAGAVIGGYTNGNATGNAVILDNASARQLIGGTSLGGKASSNTVELKNGSKAGIIYGGLAYDIVAGAEGNTVTLKGDSTVQFSVYGGYASLNKASGNKLIMTGASGETLNLPTMNAGGYAIDGNAENNELNVSGGVSVQPLNDTGDDDVSPPLYGGVADNGNATGNKVNISTTGEMNLAAIVGGYSTKSSDDTTGHTVTNNDVIISNGKASTGLIAGGISEGTNEDKEVSGNTVTLAGGTISPSSSELNIVAGLGLGGTVKDNAINLNSSMDLSNANLYGWSNDLKMMSSNAPTGVAVSHSGNTLNVNAGDIKVGSLNNFDVINFGTVPWITDGSVLTLVGDKDSDLSGTTVDTTHISFTNLNSIANSGNYAMKLLNVNGKETGLTAGNLKTQEGKWDIGNALTGKGIASLDSNGNVVYQMETTKAENSNGGETVPVVEAAEQTHQALIANEAGMGILATGRDRMEGVLDGLQNQGKGTITFASFGGGRDRYDTGSSVTTHTWNGLAGIGNDTKLTNGDLSYGVFYEYGKGNYDTSGDGYSGSGDTHYNGGGIMGKFIGKNKTYVEGSLRFGQLDNDADSVLHGTDGLAQSYKTSQNYWAGHIGVGHIFDLTDRIASESRGGTERAVRDLDVYGKYFHTHLGSDTFTAGDVKYDIDSMNSDLLRIGARVNNRSGNNDFYYGLAWDYEFSGESTGRVSAAGLSAPIRKADIGGSSLMAEAGWQKEATKDNPWELNLSLKAYMGQHEGLGGNIWAAYHF